MPKRKADMTDPNETPDDALGWDTEPRPMADYADDTEPALETAEEAAE